VVVCAAWVVAGELVAVVDPVEDPVEDDDEAVVAAGFPAEHPASRAVAVRATAMPVDGR
jgi:hypothetical protein